MSTYTSKYFKNGEQLDEALKRASSAVSFEEQTLSHAQQLQARINIGAASSEAVGQLSEEKADNPAAVVGTAIGEKCAEFSALMNNTDKVESFVFFTDPHLAEGNNYEEQMRSYLDTLKTYYDATPTSFVVCGGDWIGNSDTQNEACFKLGFIDGQMRSRFDEYYPVLGNHDSNYQGVDDSGTVGTGTLTNETIRNLMFRENGGLYYSFNAPNTKFYVLDIGTDWDSTMSDYRWEQVEWLANQLLQDDAQYIAVVVHMMFSSGNLYGMANHVLNVLKAYNDRSSLTLENGTSFDFATATGRVEFVLSGHTHEDNVVVVNEIPVIVTANMRSGNTPTFDICMADYTNRKLHMVRVGSGESREVDLYSEQTGEVILIRHNISGVLLQKETADRAVLVSTIQTGDNAVPYNYQTGEASPYYPVALPRGVTKVTVTCPGLNWGMVTKYINGSGGWSNYTDYGWQESGIILDIDSWPTHYHIGFKKVDGTNFETNADVSGIAWTFE